MNVGIRCYIGISLSIYNDSTVVVVKASIIVLLVEDEMGWIEITTNVWCVVQFARIVEAAEKGVLFDGNLTAKGCILYGYWPPALGLLTA